MRNEKANLKLATLFVLCASTCGALGHMLSHVTGCSRRFGAKANSLAWQTC